MTRPHIIAAVALLIASTAGAADSPSFAAASAKSAEEFKTDQGQYGIAFMKTAGKALVPAAQACKGSAAKAGSYHDVVFIVSASGRIEHVIHGQRSAYGDCVTSHLHMPGAVAKPPTGSWPIHVRFLHGIQSRHEQPPYMVVSDGATASATRDGSTLERAIIVTEPERSSRQWQWNYLDRQFPGHSSPPKRRVAADAATRRVWEEFSFTWKGQKTSVWFDVTQPFREYAGSTREYREFAKPPPRPR